MSAVPPKADLDGTRIHAVELFSQAAKTGAIGKAA
jgi:hypothetical protein